MVKKLFLSIALLITTVSCAKGHEERTVSFGAVEVIERQNFILSMPDCPNFIRDINKAMQALVIACEDASFEYPTNIFDDNILSDSVTVYYVYGTKGYAALFVDAVDKSCVVEFCCEDDSYSYVEFLRSFMATFQILNHPAQCNVTFTDLLDCEPDLYDQIEDTLQVFHPIEK